MTVADDQLAEIGFELDAWDPEDAGTALGCDDCLPGCAVEALTLLEAVRPIIPIVIKLGAGPAPGTDAAEDAWWVASVALARRVLAQRSAGLDRGLASDGLRLLDRIDSMVGDWSGGWGDIARGRVRELVAAGRRGRQRGREFRALREDPEPRGAFNVGWLLRHPPDHYLRRAAQTVADSQCHALIESLIAQLAPAYEELSSLDWTADEAVADVICQMRVLAVSSGSWTKPVAAIVTMPVKGGTSFGERLAIRLVEDFHGPFSGTLVSVLAGERWLICARELDDGTLLPLDGTRRRAAPRL